MKVWFDKRLSDPTYYIQIGYRDAKGKATTKNVFKVGKHSELLENHEDPLAYAQEVALKMTEEKGIKKLTLVIDLEKRLEASTDIISKSTVLNIGYFFLDKLYQDLKIEDILAKVLKGHHITFDPYLIERILVFDRILDPSSKLHTIKNLHKYYEGQKFDHQHILRFMDILEANFDTYISDLYTSSNKVIKRDTTICYYDCTNFYFEIEKEDDDYIDPYTGELIEGFRKYGYSKEHRPNPIVQMGLFIDKDGIPLSMCLSSGYTAEVKTALPLEKELVRIITNNDFIYCANAGLGQYDIRRFNAMGGRRFIVTQSLKKLPQVLKEAVFNDFDYKLLSSDRPISLKTLKDFDPKCDPTLYKDRAYKEVDASKDLLMAFYEEKIINGKKRQVKAKGNLKQRLIITFSRQYMEYQRTIRNGQIARAKSLLDSKDPDSIKKGPNDIRRFLKRKDGSEDSYILDEEKIKEEEKYDGFYCLTTNVYEKPISEILEITSDRYKIEECFLITKSDLIGRPAYHHLRKRLIAHFMICYTSLLIYRNLEVKLDRNGTHFTTRQIIDTLKNMNVTSIDGLVYKALYTNSKVLEALASILELGLDKEYYLQPTLNNMIKKRCKKKTTHTTGS